MKCNLIKQGYPQGSCLTEAEGGRLYACEATLQQTDNGSLRLISAAHLSRPENYLSIYQSGCNFSCRKCHSWSFTKIAKGDWWSPADVLKACKEYEKEVTVREPRSRATAFHARDACRCCGACVMQGKRSPLCPRAIQKKEIILSQQGWGPARNIVAFAGGDLTAVVGFVPTDGVEHELAVVREVQEVGEARRVVPLAAVVDAADREDRRGIQGDAE